MTVRPRAARGPAALVTALLALVGALGLVSVTPPPTQAAPTAAAVRTLSTKKIAMEHGSQMRDMVTTKRRTFVSKLDQLWVLNPDGSVHRKIKGPSGAGELTLSPDGKRLYQVSAPGLYVWDTHTLKVLQRVPLDICSGHIMLTGGRIFYVGGRHCQTVKSVGAIKRGHAVPTGIQAGGPLVLAGGGSTLAVADVDTLPGPVAPRITSYRVHGSRLVRLASVDRPGGFISRLYADRAGRNVYVPSACCPGQVTSLRLTTLREGITYAAEHRGEVLTGVAISPDGRSVVLALGDSPVDLLGFRVGSPTSIWSARTGAPDDAYRPRVVGPTLRYSEDGKRLRVLVSEPPHIRGRVSPLYLSSLKA